VWRSTKANAIRQRPEEAVMLPTTSGSSVLTRAWNLGRAVENAPNVGKQRHNVASDGFRFHELINGKDDCVLAVIADVPHNEAERGKETLNSALTLRKHSKKSSKDTLGKQK